MGPEVSSHPLNRADGSATFSSNLYTVLAAVNGPVEVQRRDELPEEAAIEVNIRPSSGVGGPRERWLESIVAAVLRSVLLVHMHPRTLIQVTLQITKVPTLRIKATFKDVAVLPPLINAAFLALVESGLQLQSTMSATLLAFTSTNRIQQEPSEQEMFDCKSIHALAFNNVNSGLGDLLLNESAGNFDLGVWDQIEEIGRKACWAATGPPDQEDGMADWQRWSQPWLRQELEGKAQAAVAWREAT